MSASSRTISLLCLLLAIGHIAEGVDTTGGTQTGTTCVFPFTYGGEQKNECIEDRFCVPWCATTSDYINDRQWGVCILDKPGGAIGTYDGNSDCADCVFPFTYNNVSRSQCILDKSADLWCATTSDYETDRKWGKCIISAQSITTADQSDASTTTASATGSSDGTDNTGSTSSTSANSTSSGSSTTNTQPTTSTTSSANPPCVGIDCVVNPSGSDVIHAHFMWPLLVVIAWIFKLR